MDTAPLQLRFFIGNFIFDLFNGFPGITVFPPVDFPCRFRYFEGRVLGLLYHATLCHAVPEVFMPKATQFAGDFATHYIPRHTFCS